MPKFTLICDHSNNLDTHVVKHEFTSEHIYDVLDNFQMFLKGAGYVFDGDIDIVTDDLQNLFEDEWTAVRRADAIAEGGELHSKYYYDTERNN